MKTIDVRRNRTRDRVVDACFFMAPFIVIFGGILWLYLEGLFPLRVTQMITTLAGWR